MLLVVLIGLRHISLGQNTRKTMLKQLAVLKGYIITAEKGYRIAEEGVHLIRDIKSGEFNLHAVFFGSLKVVDEGVSGSPLPGEVFGLVTEMEKVFGQAARAYASSGWLRSDEMEYIGELRQKVWALNRKDENVLRALTADGVLSMTDGERIRKIDEISVDVRIRNGQVKSFLTGVAWLIVQREKEQAYTGTLKKWYGIQ
jgi:hypothetical protein